MHGGAAEDVRPEARDRRHADKPGRRARNRQDGRRAQRLRRRGLHQRPDGRVGLRHVEVSAAAASGHLMALLLGPGAGDVHEVHVARLQGAAA
eukprot:1668890-Prymnesium_polylepis.1